MTKEEGIIAMFIHPWSETHAEYQTPKKEELSWAQGKTNGIP